MIKKISIEIIQLGTEKKRLFLPVSSSVAYLRSKIAISENVSIFMNSEEGGSVKAKSSHILNDKDVLSFIVKMRGEATVKSGGRVWRIHKNDLDTVSPSDFHAHDCSSCEKLNLYTGKIYRGTPQSIGKISMKIHKLILNDLLKYECYREKAESVLQTLI